MSINSKTKAAVDTLLTDNATTEAQFKTGLQDLTTELDLAQTRLTGASAISTIDIDGGSINGTTVGATSASSGAFTTLTASSTATFGDVDVNGGEIDGTPIGANSASTINTTALSLNGTAVTATATELNRTDGLTSAILEANDIGSTVQGYDAGLNYLDGLNFTNEATFKAAVNLEIGTDIQASNANLTDIAAITQTAGDFIISNGTDYIALQNNFAASTAPVVGNDNTQGYAVGSLWIDTTNDKIYQATDVATGAAVWVDISQASGTGEQNTTSNSGAGEGLAQAKSGVDLPFKSLTSGSGISLTGNANDVNIATSGNLPTLAGLAVADGNFIVGTGAAFTVESGATARTSLGLGTLATQNTVSNASWSGTDLAIANGGTGASDAATARTNLGLGSVATANDIGEVVGADGTSGQYLISDGDGTATWTTVGASTVNNDDWSGTDLAIVNGGTGASTASDARTNLGVAIGSDVQAWDTNLDQIAGLAVTNSNFIVGNGTAWVAETGSTARASLGLGSLATLSSVNNGNWSGTDLAVANGGTGASDTTTARSNLGLEIGTDVQGWDQALEDISGLAVTNGNFIVGDGVNWVAENTSTARTSLGLGSLATLSTINNNNWSGTDLAVANGGTGASDAATARTNLGLGTLATLNSVSATEIDTGAVGSSEIASNAVNADELNVSGNGTSGQVLSSDGDGSFSWIDAGGAALTGGMEVFNSSGNFAKPSNANMFYILVHGGGGGGAQGTSGGSYIIGGGGGAGAIVLCEANEVSANTTITVGAGGNTGTSGGSGGVSSFGNLIVCNGGGGGSRSNSSGITASGGNATVNMTTIETFSASGGNSFTSGANSSTYGGGGGGAYWGTNNTGYGGGTGTSSQAYFSDASLYAQSGSSGGLNVSGTAGRGAGGGGRGNNSGSGVAGGAGRVVIIW